MMSTTMMLIVDDDDDADEIEQGDFRGKYVSNPRK